MKGCKTSQAAKAGLSFPPSRIRRYVKKAIPKLRVAKLAHIYLTAVLEYMSAEILELAGDAARDNKRIRITPRHIFLAVANDEELKKVLKGVVIAQGGVLPLVHPFLLSTAKVKQNIVAKAKKNPLPKTKAPVKSKVVLSPLSPKNFKKQPVVSLVKLNQNSKDVTNLKPVKGINVLLEKNLFLGQKLTVVKGDILNIASDAIVNPTNKDFYMGGQIGQLLEKVGGNEFNVNLENLRKENGPLLPAGVALSLACNTAARYVIYCNGPTRRDTKLEELLEKTVKNCLGLADNENFTTLSMPLIGSGRAALPKDVAVKIVLKAINSYFMSVMTSSLKQIYLVLFTPEIIQATLKELENI